MCSGGESTPHHEESGHRYYRCTRCGFVFLSPRPSREELDRLYQEEAGATFHHDSGIAAAYEKDLEARWRLSTVAAALRQAPGKSALEIGCGAGYLLARLKRFGWRVAGTEKSDAYLRFARERLGIEAGQELPDGPFGAVLLFDVLSHLHDFERDLYAFHDRLLPGGVLVIETGNVAEVDAHRAGPFGAPDHVWHFSEPTLRSLLARVGYGETRVTRRNVEWQRRILGWIGGLRGKAPPAAAGGAPAPAPSGESVKRKIAAQALLGLRFGLGRLLADDRHACTLFVTARRP